MIQRPREFFFFCFTIKPFVCGKFCGRVGRERSAVRVASLGQYQHFFLYGEYRADSLNYYIS